MASIWRAARPWIAAAVAPLSLFPLVLAGTAYDSFQVDGHRETFWDSRWLFWIGFIYVGSALGALLARLAGWLLKTRPSLLSVTATFFAGCCAIVFVWVLVNAPAKSWALAAIAVPVLMAVPCTIVALAYGLIAGLPWRAPRAA